ncbi:unnamed protein product [Lampetra fluviatilis]
MVGWSDVQALRALQATLDDDTLAAFITIPKRDRATLLLALWRMSDIYRPPSDVLYHFYERRRNSKELPLAFRTALLAMARAAYPRMDDEAINADVLQKLLKLARELHIVIQAVDDENVFATGSSEHPRSSAAPPGLNHRRLGFDIGACCMDAGLSPDRFATTRPAGRRSSDHAGRRDDQQRGRPSPRNDVMFQLRPTGPRINRLPGASTPLLPASGPRPQDVHGLAAQSVHTERWSKGPNHVPSVGT